MPTTRDIKILGFNPITNPEKHISIVIAQTMLIDA
jgi:hypothetical protein